MSDDKERRFGLNLNVFHLNLEAYKKPAGEWRIVIIDRQEQVDRKLDLPAKAAGELSIAIRELLYQLHTKG
jgi:hypothetical protein